MDLTELVVVSHHHLDGLRVAHAFGGALALGYHAQPRATMDVDINVFVAVPEVAAVVSSFEPIGFVPRSPVTSATPVAGIRLEQAAGRACLDLFPSLDDIYGEIADRAVTRPFGPDRVEIPILAAEDLAAFKLSFNRPRDWVDLDALAAARPDLDVELVERTVLALRGPTMHPRVARLRQLLATDR